MLNLEQSNVWELVKTKLLAMQEKALSNLQNEKNSREEDIGYKARLSVIKELLLLPQHLETPGFAAKLKRVHGQQTD